MNINEESLKQIQATIKHAKVHAVVISEREGKIKGEEKIFKEIAVASYSNLFKFNLCIKKNSSDFKKNNSNSHINEG